MPAQPEKNDFDNLLHAIYEDQKHIIHTWGITIPPEDQIFRPGCPLETKVLFFDWLIREGLSA